MGLIDTPGQSETSCCSMAESSFISSSMGTHFGIFERLDFIFAVFFLGFMENAFSHSIGILHRHGFGTAGRKKEPGLSEGLHNFESGVRSELAEEEARRMDVYQGELSNDGLYNFNACGRKRTCSQD